ncbi:MAG: hypothetical protein UV58_C0024G0011 [Candidatus Wolfebacteria bacterium GW2011_GWC1_43_10]|uniref:Uncharacterized protein n=2 Tax=Candidatus Wolfeibacteriota TaxID=1752735 RepID=A0A0G1C6V0_9BACT|nr:MAG: hypothetical protein UV58_C0024G0011 [Candidatus Wolfebacteria bacterium GW2011_GWC1_43_10]KKT22882.1 MAG: hypothetical protein UW08_C0002G0011 [Parcubacteria group bacterium GW2011_GWB1_43_8b]OGM89830.1 MAG: hypothetical protein A2108_02800 [Candidatus Wolfebacteria bacterium GWA1_42_9]
MNNNGKFFSDIFWRYLTHIWTLIFLVLLVSDFIYQGRFSYLLTPFSVVYGAILSIFVGTKEFSRWQNIYKSKNHPGEIFVIIWSVLLLALLSASWVLGKDYKISSEIVSVYIMVLTVFALTQSSKRIYRQKRKVD